MKWKFWKKNDKPKMCKARHPYWKRTKCQRPKGHSGQHIARKMHGLTHILYYAWHEDGTYNRPVLKRKKL